MHSSASDLHALLVTDLLADGRSGELTPETDEPADWAAHQLRKSLIKKFHNDETNSVADAAALSLFLKVNEECRKYSFSLDGCNDVMRTAIGEAQAFLYRVCHVRMGTYDASCLSLQSIAEGFGLGNGSNIGSKSPDFYSKVATSSMAHTRPELLIYYKHAISSMGAWRDVEVYRAKYSQNEIVQGSRLSFVPKTSEISRTICTEPVLNMLFQKGIADVLTRQLRRVTGIDLSTQPGKNVELARIGSIAGRYGTIDLSSASDSMSSSLVQLFFPRQFVSWLELTRCAKTTLPGGEMIDLHMVSSMGNAFTFPLQTIFFSSLVFGAYRALGIKIENPRGSCVGNYAVFGDDIIVRSEAYDLVTEMLSLCGFTVNKDKSFNTGLFRESCGSDFFRGHNVRGVYIKTLRDASDYYSAVNRLVRWSARNGILLPNVVRYLTSRCRFLPIPPDESDDAGIKVPFGLLDQKFLCFNRNGAVRYRARKLRDFKVRIPFDDGSQPSEFWDGDYTPLPAFSKLRCSRLPGFFYNPAGLLLTALQGSISGGSVSLRSNRRRAYLSKEVTPRWDYNPYCRSERPGFGDDWKVVSWVTFSIDGEN